MIAPTAIIRGVGITFGMDLVEVEGATGFYDSNYKNKFKSAYDQITSPKYDFGFLHIKGVDDAGHDKNYDMKVQLLHQIDIELGIFMTRLAESSCNDKTEYLVCITGDHTTPVSIGDHCFEPVPFTFTSATNYLMVAAKAEGKEKEEIKSEVSEGKI